MSMRNNMLIAGQQQTRRGVTAPAHNANRPIDNASRDSWTETNNKESSIGHVLGWPVDLQMETRWLWMTVVGVAISAASRRDVKFIYWKSEWSWGEEVRT